MKNFFKILGVAFLGGAMAIGGYKLFVEKPIVIEQTADAQLQTYQTNFPSTNVSNVTAVPTDFTEAAEKTVHAVVYVKNTAIRTNVNSLADLFYGNGARRAQVGTGSGVIISPDGYVISNNHVIANATDLEITLNNNQKYKAQLIGTDEKNDIALLKIDADEELPYVTFADSDNVKVGEWVLAVGNPFNLKSTVTAGIVSAKGRDLEGNTNIEAFIQTDAAVNPGNSGGALVNTRGELVGINTAITSRTGSFIGYSFAVPSNIARKIVDDLLEFGNVQEAILGINIDNTPEARNIEGVKIANVSEDGGADVAGVKVGDVIKKVNDVKIRKFSDLKGQLTAKRPGELVNVTIDRDGEEFVTQVKLSKKDVFSALRFGVQLKDISKADKKKYGIDYGAKVIGVPTNKGFRRFNVGEGYVLLKINGKKVTSASEATSILDRYNGRQNMYLEMMNPQGQLERYNY